MAASIAHGYITLSPRKRSPSSPLRKRATFPSEYVPLAKEKPAGNLLHGKTNSFIPRNRASTRHDGPYPQIKSSAHSNSASRSSRRFFTVIRADPFSYRTISLFICAHVHLTLASVAFTIPPVPTTIGVSCFGGSSEI